MADSRTLDEQLLDLRRRADEDFLHPEATREAGRHQVDLPELGLRVSITRSRYPNRPDGIDQYAVTMSRPELDRPPGNQEVRDGALDRPSGTPRSRPWSVPEGRADQDVPGAGRRPERGADQPAPAPS